MVALNTRNALAGAGTGAIYGAQFGGPVGSAIGAGVGGIAGLFSPKAKGPQRKSTFDPTQQGLYDQYAQALQGGGGPLGDIFGQFDPEQVRQLYEQMYAQPAYQNFQENIIPSITGQFRGQNLQNSSYLGGALAKAGTNVQNNLNAQMSNMLYQGQQQNQQNRMQGVQGLLGMNTFDWEQPQPSVFDNLLGSMANGAGQMMANKFSGGGMGGMGKIGG